VPTMTELPDFLPETPNPIAFGLWMGRDDGPTAAVARTRVKSGQIGPVRHWLGDRPTNFLNARLNAASDS